MSAGVSTSVFAPPVSTKRCETRHWPCSSPRTALIMNGPGPRFAMLAENRICCSAPSSVSPPTRSVSGATVRSGRAGSRGAGSGGGGSCGQYSTAVQPASTSSGNTARNPIRKRRLIVTGWPSAAPAPVLTRKRRTPPDDRGRSLANPEWTGLVVAATLRVVAHLDVADPVVLGRVLRIRRRRQVRVAVVERRVVDVVVRVDRRVRAALDDHDRHVVRLVAERREGPVERLAVVPRDREVLVAVVRARVDLRADDRAGRAERVAARVVGGLADDRDILGAPAVVVGRERDAGNRERRDDTP